MSAGVLNSVLFTLVDKTSFGECVLFIGYSSQNKDKIENPFHQMVTLCPGDAFRLTYESAKHEVCNLKNYHNTKLAIITCFTSICV